MNRRAFQILAVGNLLLVVSAGIVGAVLIDALPGRLAQFVHEQIDQPFGNAEGVGVVVLIGLMVSHFGVARFRRWARPVLVASVAGLILSNLLSGAYVGHQVEVLLFDAFLVLEGVLIASAYLGPASHEFTERPKGSHRDGADQLDVGQGGAAGVQLQAKGALSGVVCGILVGSSVGYVAHEYAVHRYATAQLATVEEMSTEFYTQFSPEASQAAQGAYTRYSYNAWREGAITGNAYHRAQAIGWLRYCSEEEQHGDHERAKKLCEMARNEFELWDSRIEFSDFANMVRSRERH